MVEKREIRWFDVVNLQGAQCGNAVREPRSQLRFHCGIRGFGETGLHDDEVVDLVPRRGIDLKPTGEVDEPHGWPGAARCGPLGGEARAQRVEPLLEMNRVPGTGCGLVILGGQAVGPEGAVRAVCAVDEGGECGAKTWRLAVDDVRIEQFGDRGVASAKELQRLAQAPAGDVKHLVHGRLDHVSTRGDAEVPVALVDVDEASVEV